jgi:hypothetical protein
MAMVINIMLKKRFNEYSQRPLLKTNLNGKQISEKMLSYYNINNVDIVLTRGYFTDHYNPITRKVNLSYHVFYNCTITAAAIAAHECGHALQYHLEYKFIILRAKLLPLVGISSKLSNLLIMFGLSFFYHTHGKSTILIKIGIALFLSIVIFSIITLPIEFDASRRGLKWLQETNIIDESESHEVKDILKWAAMTYLLSAFGAVTQLIYFLSFINNNENKKNITKN